MPQKRTPTRDEKLQNLMFNYSMLIMASFEGAFSTLASGMTQALVEGANAMADAMSAGLGGASDSTGTPKVAKSSGEAASEVSKAVAQMFSEMRKEMTANVSFDDPSFKDYIKNPEFDRGIGIVEGHDFRLPSLTERLSDDDLASYMILLKSEDPELGKMLQELGEWQKAMPKFPDAPS